MKSRGIAGDETTIGSPSKFMMSSMGPNPGASQYKTPNRDKRSMQAHPH
jgi:hypothetical protein